MLFRYGQVYEVRMKLVTYDLEQQLRVSLLRKRSKMSETSSGMTVVAMIKVLVKKKRKRQMDPVATFFEQKRKGGDRGGEVDAVV